ncbi:MAG: hypothetical protein WC222_11275 [Parachlamydiales bacterium]|jgi:hypothetical protein
MVSATDRTEYSYVPIIKNIGFNPKPIAGKIPIYADSLSNPKCLGTRAWEEFWLEQIYYCLNGYDTGGIHLPGRYYYYLNYDIIKGLHGSVYPDFVDVHYQLALLVEEVKREGKAGIIIPKARRKGLSVFGDNLCSWGSRFIPDYRMGVAGGLERYVKGFRLKLFSSFNNVPPELKLSILKKNDDELKIGWEEKNNSGGFDEIVIALSQFATLNEQATKLEGEFFHDCVMEESGQFELLDEAYESIKPALELGERTLGTFYFFGTGGNMLKGSKAFKDIWHNSESYNLVRFFIPGNRFHHPYYGGAREIDGQLAEKIDEIKEMSPGLHPEQYLGCEAVSQAKESILEERRRRSKNPDKKVLIDWNKKYPLTVEEVFTSSGSNKFNTDLLYTQMYQIQEVEQKWKEYCLDIVKDKEGMYVLPLQVEARPRGKKDKDWECVEILEHPKPNIKDLDIEGVDGYNEDKTTTSQSLGGIVVLRRYNVYRNAQWGSKILPICHYLKRPPRKEQHWEMALKVAIYYNTIKNCIISAESDMVIDYFKKNHGKKYLSPRPKAFDAPEGQQQHDFGVKMTQYSKPRMLSLMQSWVEDNADVIFFLDLLLNLIAYDEENIGTDWDDADAVGYALMRIVDMKHDPKDRDVDDTKLSDLPEYREKDGILMDITSQPENTWEGPHPNLWKGEKDTRPSKQIMSDLD